MLGRARDAADAGDRRREAAMLREALALWRGEPLADLPSETLRRDVAARLGERRPDALHRRIEVDLALGRHADPLQAYHRVAGLLADELGVDPGAELRALHQAVLTGDPALTAPPSPARRQARAKPSQLPVDVGDFVGRTRLVDQLAALLAHRRPAAPAAGRGARPVPAGAGSGPRRDPRQSRGGQLPVGDPGLHRRQADPGVAFFHEINPAVPHVSTPLSLGVILGILAIATVASLLAVRRDPSRRAHAGSLRQHRRDHEPVDAGHSARRQAARNGR